MSFLFCTSYAIAHKAGDFRNKTLAASGALMEQFSNEAEAYICAATHYDWITNYSLLGASFKPILADAASAKAAISLILQDDTGYMGRASAEDNINILWATFIRCVEILKEQETKDVMGAV